MSGSEDWAARKDEAEIARIYNDLGPRDEFDESQAYPVTGPRDTIVSIRFARGELELLEKRAQAADMKLTTFIRTAAVRDSAVLVELRQVLRHLESVQNELEAVIGPDTGSHSVSSRPGS